jgi:hypothetical protein
MALLTHTSIGPNLASACSAAASTASASATSAGNNNAWPPSLSTSRLALSRRSLPRAIKPIRAPSVRAKACAIARPRPAEAPVITTTRWIFRRCIAGIQFAPCRLVGSMCRCPIPAMSLSLLSGYDFSRLRLIWRVAVLLLDMWREEPANSAARCGNIIL